MSMDFDSQKVSYKQPYRCRLSVVISEQQRDKLQKLLPWGTMTRVYSVLTDQLIEALEAHGEFTIAAIVSKRVNILDMIKAANPEKNEGE